MPYDTTTLEDDVKALEARLATPGDSAGQSIISKALDLAKDALAAVTGKGNKTKKSGKALAGQLAKARQDDEEGEDENEDDEGDEDEVDPDTQAFIDKLLASDASEDDDKEEMMEKSKLRKALDPGDWDAPAAIEVNGYLKDELAIRERMRADLSTVLAQQGALRKAMAAVLQDNAALRQAVGTLLKGHMALLEHINDLDAVPASGSKYDAMLKSIRPLLGPGGGQEMPYNKERASQMLIKGLLTPAQHKAWKHTNRLPDGVTIS